MMQSTIDAIKLLQTIRDSHDIVRGPLSIYRILYNAIGHLDASLNTMIRGEK